MNLTQTICVEYVIVCILGIKPVYFLQYMELESKLTFVLTPITKQNQNFRGEMWAFLSLLHFYFLSYKEIMPGKQFTLLHRFYYKSQ